VSILSYFYFFQHKIFDTDGESPRSARLDEDGSSKGKGPAKKKLKAKRPSDRVRSKTPDETVSTYSLDPNRAHKVKSFIGWSFGPPMFI
jgi:hypothetical protein